jgi:CBS domain-containing protein
MGLINRLRDAEPFHHLPEQTIEEFARAAVLKKFPPQTHIFNQQDPPTGYLYVIKQGLVEIVVLTPGGVEMVVDYRKDGSFFGGTPIFTNESYTAGARTVKETECYLVPAELVARAAQQEPKITEHFTRAILSRVRSLYSDMVGDHSQKALTQVEAYPFQKRLSEIMSTPAETCGLDTPVKELAGTMVRKGVGAMLVCDPAGRLTGIITEHDLVAKIVAVEDAECRGATAADVMTQQPFSMAPDTYMYEAATYMMGHRIKHLPVLDRGEIVGIVTLQDLMKYRSQKSMLLVGSVREAQSIEALAAAKTEMVKVARVLLSEARSPFETMEILSYIHHCILQRAFDIILDEMMAEGMAPPDIRFCLFIMGSGGRKEMLLNPDQDNGIIYEDFPAAMKAEVDAFFVPFAERLVTAYAQIGYPLCNGEVMVNNPLWRGRLREWEARVTNWINVPEPKKVMYSTIFFDFMPLVGDPSLCQELREVVHRELDKTPRFLFHLLENDLNHKAPIGLLGRFVVEREGQNKGKLSLKKAGSVFIIDCIRMFVLERGIDAATSIERLEQLVQLNVFNQETAEHIKAALEAFTFLRLRNEIGLIDQGQPPSDYIDPYALTKNEQDLLREAFRVAGKLQDSARKHFGRGML